MTLVNIWIIIAIIWVYILMGFGVQNYIGWDDYPIMGVILWPVLLIIAILLEIKKFIENEIIDRFR